MQNQIQSPRIGDQVGILDPVDPAIVDITKKTMQAMPYQQEARGTCANALIG
jgi:hypothetical protein